MCFQLWRLPLSDFLGSAVGSEDSFLFLLTFDGDSARDILTGDYARDILAGEAARCIFPGDSGLWGSLIGLVSTALMLSLEAMFWTEILF